MTIGQVDIPRERERRWEKEKSEGSEAGESVIKLPLLDFYCLTEANQIESTSLSWRRVHAFLFIQEAPPTKTTNK